jgi:hypothetical protein
VEKPRKPVILSEAKNLASRKIIQLWRGFSFELIVGEVPARVAPAEIGLVPFLGLDNLNH